MERIAFVWDTSLRVTASQQSYPYQQYLMYQMDIIVGSVWYRCWVPRYRYNTCIVLLRCAVLP